MKRLILLIVLLVITGFFLKPSIWEKLGWDKKPLAACKLSGSQTKDTLLDSYIVQTGDTLAGIAFDKLGDGQRAQEIVELNSDRYITLSSNPVLTEGWKLYLPPKNGGKKVSNMHVFAGRVIGSTINQFTIHGKNQEMSFSPDVNTQYLDIKPIEIDDCLLIGYNGDTQKVYIVGSQ